MNHNHQENTYKTSLISKKLLLICLGLVGAGAAAVTLFGIPANTVFLGAILLACPLMHLWMMGGNHKH